MDPNATLQEIRELVGEIELATDEEREAELASALAEQVRALDEWLSSGGFKPADWARA